MKNIVLIIFVEWSSDELFVNNVVEKTKLGVCIKIYKYAKKTRESIEKYIETLNKMYNDPTNLLEKTMYF